MQKSFYVARSGETLGPFEIDEIIRKIHAGELSMTDYIYVQDKRDWVVIVDFSVISEKVKGNVSSPQAQESRDGLHLVDLDQTQVKFVGDETRVDMLGLNLSEPEEVEWFMLKGEEKFGPFSMVELIKMLREKVIFEFDYVWNKKMTAWKRISEVSEFSPIELKKMKATDGSMKDSEEIFFRRRHARVHYGSSVIVHNQKEVWKGKGLEVSAGGAGLKMDHGDFKAGETIYLHFQPGDGVPAFNAVCEVVSQREISELGQEAKAYRYGVKFKQIGSEARKYLANYAKSKAEAGAQPMDRKSAA